MTLREQLEASLRARGWGATLPQAGAQMPPEEAALAAWAHGPARGAITELAGSAGSGVSAGALRLAAITAGRIAWADPHDQLDPASAERAGIALERLLWLRGHAGLRGLEGLSRWNEILNLVIQSHAVELVVADFLDWPLAELGRIPRSAWFRLLRGLEHGGSTALLLLVRTPLSRGCARLVLGAPKAPERVPTRLAGIEDAA